MKLKKINSINYGSRIIFIGIILIILIPLILFGINCVIHASILQYLILTSIILGFIIEAVFFVHLSIELWQDKKSINTIKSTEILKPYTATANMNVETAEISMLSVQIHNVCYAAYIFKIQKTKVHRKY